MKKKMWLLVFSLLLISLTVIAQDTTIHNNGLTVDGTIESTNGGVMFPDGSVQSTAVGATTRYEFVGFSSGTSNGGGIWQFHKMCQADYPSSRMCMGEEIINSVNIPTVTGQGWVHPSSELNNDQYSGCYGWSAGVGAYSGLTVTADGKLYPRQCNNIYPVACCAPAP